MFNRCNHKWSVMANERTTPPLHIIQGNGQTVTRGCESWAQEKVIVILACDKCGKLNKTVTSNL